jgi:hypothetical protein
MESAFYQIRLDSANDQQLSAVITEEGLYEFISMPMGLGSSSGTMQRLTDIILRGIKNARGFIDDVIVFSEDYDSHLKDLKEVFD